LRTSLKEGREGSESRPKDKVTLRKTYIRVIVKIILFFAYLCHLMLRFKPSLKLIIVGIQIKNSTCTHTQKHTHMKKMKRKSSMKTSLYFPNNDFVFLAQKHKERER
jgi:hypothetical protein